MNPKGTFLFISNDVWFDYKKFIKENKGNFWWFHYPKKVLLGSTVYMYLSGGTKAVKYEFKVIEIGKLFKELNINYDKYIVDKKTMPKKSKKSHGLNQKMLKLELVRELKDLSQTTPSKLKEKGGILGTLMSNRELHVPSIKYLNSCS